MPGILRLRARGRVRSPKGEMNKLERRFVDEILEPKRLAGLVLWYAYEAVKLRLAKGLFLDIDFLVVQKDLSLECYDVKARWSNGQVGEEDARAKLKMAGEKFPFRVLAAVWDRKTGWNYEEF